MFKSYPWLELKISGVSSPFLLRLYCNLQQQEFPCFKQPQRKMLLGVHQNSSPNLSEFIPQKCTVKKIYLFYEQASQGIHQPHTTPPHFVFSSAEISFSQTAIKSLLSLQYFRLKFSEQFNILIKCLHIFQSLS